MTITFSVIKRYYVEKLDSLFVGTAIIYDSDLDPQNHLYRGIIHRIEASDLSIPTVKSSNLEEAIAQLEEWATKNNYTLRELPVGDQKLILLCG